MKKTIIQTMMAALMIFSCAVTGLAAGQPEPIETIDISGLPFTGPEGAPVTIVAFSDYL